MSNKNISLKYLLSIYYVPHSQLDSRWKQGNKQLFCLTEPVDWEKHKIYLKEVANTFLVHSVLLYYSHPP